MSTQKTSLVVMIAAACSLPSLATAAVTSASFKFDVSNTYNLAGVEYGSVSIEADDTTGVVTFTVDAYNVQPTYGTLSNFGIQAFAFNTVSDSVIDAIDSVSNPSGWKFDDSPNNSFSMFGKFDAADKGKGNSRMDPLVFSLTLSDTSLAVADNFASTSSEDYLFAAHIAGYENGPGSHWVGVDSVTNPDPGSSPIPAPGAIALCAFGLSFVGFLRRKQ